MFYDSPNTVCQPRSQDLYPSQSWERGRQDVAYHVTADERWASFATHSVIFETSSVMFVGYRSVFDNPCITKKPQTRINLSKEKFHRMQLLLNTSTQVKTETQELASHID